jgi:hypothetical protein
MTARPLPRGAYGRIKDLFASRGVLEKWHAFEQEAEDKALRRWCADVELEIVESDPPSTDSGAKAKGSKRE